MAAVTSVTSTTAGQLPADGAADRRLLPGLHRHRGVLPGASPPGAPVRPAAQRVEHQVEAGGGR